FTPAASLFPEESFPDGAVAIESEIGERTTIDDMSGKLVFQPVEDDFRVSIFIIEPVEETPPAEEPVEETSPAEEPGNQPASGTYKVRSTVRPSYLAESAENEYSYGSGIPFLGLFSAANMPEDANTVFYLDAVENGQYAIVSGHKKTEQYLRGRFLFNATDSAWVSGPGSAVRNPAYIWMQRYTRLAFAEGIRVDNRLYVTGDTQVTDISELEGLVQAGTVRKVDLTASNSFTFALFRVQQGVTEFFIQSGNGFIDIYNAVPIIGDHQGERNIFNIEPVEDLGQAIVIEPAPPVDGQGTIEVALNLPPDEPFSIAFTLDLPAGFVLDPDATSLAPGLQSGWQLSIAPDGPGSWQFEITPKLSLQSGDEMVRQQVVNIAYTLDGTVTVGEYELAIRDIDLTLLASGETIHPDEIRASVTVDESAVGNATVETPEIVYFNGILSVNTPVAEGIEVYSVGGQLLYRVQKAAGAATFDLNRLPRGVLIVRGSSGWVRKAVK
ncbi:MAG: hypothetical protein LBR86_05520, partial [Tannerella sp.]|nr:hypothetical protein [Tannerella sp.]